MRLPLPTERPAATRSISFHTLHALYAFFAARARYLLVRMMLSFIENWNKARSNNALCAAASAIWYMVAPLNMVTAANAAIQSGPAPEALSQADDPFLWLEDVAGERALTWVRAQNALSTRELEASPDFEPIHKRPH